ncbi:hypothetical protein FIE12Z_5253 [Fusarium flagelliforme]|uniref:Uncharacterized protein n=1 Tax=Fusarium flagelliforme TaxID=2675880 RepID=A0A395MRT4_9HYPO|nr:hypothetical protein FIE12Z_5253 [Fusarium flagelliforme]
MEFSDVRRVYDFERNGEAAANRLANYPPLWEGIQWSTGIDCLIVVIRHIYCNGMMSPDLTKDLKWFAESEALNPILGHAWHMFGKEDAEVAKATEDREKVHEVLLSLSILPSASFKDICDSSLMNETFWSQEMFRLSHPPVDATTGDAIQLSADEIAELSKLEFKPGAPGDCIQNVVDKAFGQGEWKGRQIFTVPHQPCVFRVLYRADNNLCDSVSIKQLKTLKLPVWAQVEGEECACFQEIDRVDYFLMAIVRLGAEGDRPDFVRTYSPYGQNFACAYRPRLFMANDWSISDAPQDYMLFYGYRPVDVGNIDVTDFPEVTEGREHGGTLDLIDSDMEEAKAKLQAGEAIKITTLPVNDIPPPPSEPRPSDVLDDRLERGKAPPEREPEDVDMTIAPPSASMRSSTGQDSDAMDVDDEKASV